MKPSSTIRRYCALIGAAHLLAACSTTQPPLPEDVEPEPPPATSTVAVNETAMLPLLGYYHLLQRMTPAELARERQTLANIPSSPSVHLRQAMLLGMPARTTADLSRALALLDTLQRTHTPEAASLHPLARVLTTQYQERLKLEKQNDALTLQLKDVQRKKDELQDKLDALTAIERSIPIRPNTAKPTP